MSAAKPQHDYASTDVAVRCSTCGSLYPRGEAHTCAQAGSDTAGDASQGPSGAPSDAVTSPDAAMPGADGLIGAVLGGRYQILSRLSAGGMGVVYKARHIVLKSLVAVKILLEQQDEEARLRFLQEAQLASHIQHPNTVYISDFGVLQDGRTYLVMEFLSGPTLAKALEAGPLGALRSCQVALQIARGLQVIHDKGIIHRDLKPANIFLLQQEAGKGQGAQESVDFVKIVDFGLATARPLISAESARDSLEELRDHALTQAGALMGTPLYMSPENIAVQLPRRRFRADQGPGTAWDSGWGSAPCTPCGRVHLDTRLCSSGHWAQSS